VIYIPNDYTACEVYQGRVIATKGGLYYVFNTDGYRMIKDFDSRSDARQAIDASDTAEAA
jgi:hypothetical protein